LRDADEKQFGVLLPNCQIDDAKAPMFGQTENASVDNTERSLL